MTVERDYPKLNTGVVLGFWALIAAIYAVRAAFEASHGPLFADTDDAMRLVVVRDFLGGQGWYDNMQHRLNTPYGAEIHWSRLVDLPLAMILAALRLVVSAGMAETILGYLWPALLAVRAALRQREADARSRRAARDCCPRSSFRRLSPAVMAEFSPGRIDHHGIQIILALTMAWCTMRAVREPRWAIGAGLAAATAMAIAHRGGARRSLATVLGFGLLWVLPAASGPVRSCGFGVSFARRERSSISRSRCRRTAGSSRCAMRSRSVYAAAAVAVGRRVRRSSRAARSQRRPGPRLAAGVGRRRRSRRVCSSLFFRDCLARSLCGGRSLARRQLAEPHRRSAAGLGEFCRPSRLYPRDRGAADRSASW